MRPQSMAQTVGDLERAGLVSRRPDPDDRRRAFVELTPAGRKLLHATRAQREGWLTDALERELSTGERAVVADAVALLGRVAGAEVSAALCNSARAVRAEALPDSSQSADLPQSRPRRPVHVKACPPYDGAGATTGRRPVADRSPTSSASSATVTPRQ